MQFLCRLSADVIVIVHLVYVLVVVLGLPVTWIGILTKQSWARNFWWRCGHLSMILIVVLEAWAGIVCPLTNWEFWLRELGGQETYRGSFVGNCIHEWLFYDVPHWAMTLIYSGFGLLVLTSFIVAPPRWPVFKKLAKSVVRC